MKAEQDLAQGLGCWVGCRLVLSPESWGKLGKGPRAGGTACAKARQQAGGRG